MAQKMKSHVIVQNYTHVIPSNLLQLKFSPSIYKIQIPNVDKITKQYVQKKIDSEFKNYRIQLIKERPYLSIVVVGRHDGYSNNFEERSQNFINQIGYCKELVPTANIEIIIVDEATPITNSTLDQVFTIPKSLEGLVRYIIVDPKMHEKITQRMNATYPFLEYIAKNIGIQRSLGQFILTTNLDNFISPDFFEIVARKEFNEGILYIMQRYDLYENVSDHYSPETIGKLITNFSILSNYYTVRKQCSNQKIRLYFVNDSKKYYNTRSICCPGDFLLLSKKIWDVLGGFDEYPGNKHVDTIFITKLMRLIPGFYKYLLSPVILHQHHEHINLQRKTLKDGNSKKQLMKDNICYGNTKHLKLYYENNEWGLSKEFLPEVKK